MKASRILLISVVSWIVLYVAGFVALGGSVPTVESSADEVVEWFADNAGRAQAYAWTSAFVSLVLVVFGAQIATLLPRPHRYIFFGGVLGWAITGQVQAWFWAGLALHADGLDPATARTIFDIPAYWGPIINGSTMTMAAAVAAVGFGASRLIPGWLTWLSVVFFVEQAIETVTVFGESGFIAPGGTMNVYLGGVIGIAWVIGVLYWGMKRLDSPDPEPGSPPAQS
ncbi:MAG: hypothetical protein KDB62_07190 [Solirubrobacterales bacterium]|nr:hypothetical protein [Solirubrobacterales bacterium]